MPRVRKDGLSKRDRLQTLLNPSPSRRFDTRLWNAPLLKSLWRGLNPLRYLAATQHDNLHDIELFVTRLEERRVLNGDFGLLAGVADITEMQLDTELYSSELYGGMSLLSSGQRAVEGESGNMAPAFTADPYTFSLRENSNVGTVVGTASATDADSPVLSYSIMGGNSMGAFAIDPASGVITVADKFAIDFETQPTYSLTVQVNDNHTMTPLSDTTTVNINLVNLQTLLTISAASDVENAGSLTFNVNAIGDNINQAFDVTYRTTDGTAVDGLSTLGSNDYDGTVSSVVSFAGNSTTELRTVSVVLNDDNTVENDDTFFVNLLSANSNDVTITTANATGTIQNNDSTVISVSAVVRSEGDSGTTGSPFFIFSSAPSIADITLRANTLDGSAMAGTDYIAISNQLITISAGTTSAALIVQVNGDTDVESTETFSLVLSDPRFGGVSDVTRVIIGNSASSAIINDDFASRATLSINDVTMVEGNSGTTNFVFTIQSDIVAQDNIAVTVNTSNLFDVIGGADYTELTNQVAMIAQGSTSTTVTVSVMTDAIVELDETFSVTLSNPLFNGVSNPSRVILGDGVGVGTIVNDDVARISINDVSVVEGDSGITNLVFVVSSDAVGSRDIDVRVNTATLADAFGGADYIEIISQSSVILAGASSTTVTVTVIGDTIVEIDETFSVNLTAALFNGTADASRVTIADGTGVGTIVNDDTAAISINDISALEGDNGSSSLVFTVTMDLAASRDTTVTIRSADGFQASVNADYFGIPNRDFVIAAGQTSATLTVELIGDATVEMDETLLILLSDARFGNTVDPTRIVVGDDTGVGTIANDDRATISIDDVRGIEGDAGITNFVFTVRQDALSSLDTVVTVNTRDILEAITGIDYNAIVDQVVTIAAGTRTATLTVGVIGENLVEATERFRVDLSDARFGETADASRIVIGVASGIGTILNDDAGNFLIEDIVVNEGDGTAQLTVRITSPIDVDTTLRFALDQNPDIQNLDNQITFRAGASQSQSIRFSIVDDILVEGTETYIGVFEVTRRAVGGDITATVASSIDIIDNDRAKFTLSDATVNESAGTVTLIIGTDAPFDIDATFDLIAPIQNDITFNVPSTTFAAGSTESQSITILINNDQLVELDEILNIRLVATTELGTRNVDVSDIGRLEIIDNDSATFRVQNLTVREGGGTVSFTVTVDNAIDIDTTLAIMLSSTDDVTIVTPTITFIGGSTQTQSFSIAAIDDSIEELTERVSTAISIETELGTRDVTAPSSVLLTIRDNDTPDFIQSINENILTTSVPILVPSTSTGGTSTVGGNASGANSGGAGASPATSQAPSGAGTAVDAAANGAEQVAENVSIASIGSLSQDSGTSSSLGGLQSSSSADGSAEFDGATSSQSKNTSADSDFGSDAGELLFHVVLPNGKLGKKYELDIDLLNDASLFDRFRGLPTDVYRVLYREPGSDTVQQLFEIYVVDGKIETILYLRKAPIEQIDPADDRDESAIDDGTDNDAELPPALDATEASVEPDFGRFGRHAGLMIAATLAYSKSSSDRSKNQVAESTALRPLPRMDKVSRVLRRLRRSLPR